MQRLLAVRTVRVAGSAILVVILATRMMVMQRLVSERVELLSVSDPCGADMPDIGRAYLERVWRHYGASLPPCAGIDDAH